MGEIKQTRLGIATVYGYAKAKGFTGTEEEFAQMVAKIKDIEEYADAARADRIKAENALYSVTTTKNQSVAARDEAVAAKDDVEAAQAAAEAAQVSAETAATNATVAKNAAITARDEARTAAAKYPIIQNGVWNVWDTSSGKYASTGIQAQGEAAPAELVAQEIANWMDANLSDNPTTVVDTSLTISGAAGDSKIVGDKIAALTEQIETYYAKLQGEKANANELAALYIAFDTVGEAIAAVNSGIAAAGEQIGQTHDELDAAKSELAELGDLVQTKAEVNDLAALYVESDRTKKEFEDFKADTLSKETAADDELQSLNDRVAMKAEANDVAALAVDADRTRNDLQALDDRVKMKAEANDLAALYTEVERVGQSIDGKADLNDVTRQANEIGALAVAVDRKADALETDARIKVKANQNELAEANVEIELLKTSNKALDTRVRETMSSVAALNENKINKPVGKGDAGQVLSTNGDGTTKWINPLTLTDTQISIAVSDWLSNHPESTTTVQDGSITREKLASDVINAIANTGKLQDVMVLASAASIMSNERDTSTDQIEEHTAFYDLWENKFSECAAYVNGGDAVMFTFFTDPHTMPSEAYRISPEEALLRLREVKWIYENTPSQFVLCGGDWITDSYTLQRAMQICARVPNLMRTEIGDKAYTIVGNHDINSQNPSETLTEQQLARIWFDSDVGYYTLKGNRWRMFAFDSGHMTIPMSAYRWAEVEWFAEQLYKNMDAHLFGAIHVWALANGNTELSTNLTAVADAFNRRTSITVNGKGYDFSQAFGTFHFMISGHWHSDWTRTLNNIPCFGTDATVHGLCTDVCYADFDHAILHMTRFGSGDSRDFGIIPNNGYAVE